MCELDSPTVGSVFRRNWTVLFIFIHLKFKLQMNEDEASVGCHRFLRSEKVTKERRVLRALTRSKIWTQLRRGIIDKCGGPYGKKKNEIHV
jgi:hypothetical protein